MARESGIEWCDSTWNPWRGCHKLTTGCKNCYMFRDQKRYGNDPTKVVRAASKTFDAPLKWKEKARVFTCSYSDFFIEEADGWRDDAWEIIRNTPWLTYQILTKRIDNVPARLPIDWPLDNVWLGASVENQEMAKERIPKLVDIPAALRFISAEPLLGPLNLSDWLAPPIQKAKNFDGKEVTFRGPFHWMIVGGESGKDHRPMDLKWAAKLRSDCLGVGIPFFFKQVGGNTKIDGSWGGSTLDGKQWKQMPGI